MQVKVKCPECEHEELVGVETPTVFDTPVLTIDDQATSDTTEYTCPKCGKELNIQLSIELFE